MKKLVALLKKYRELLLYLIFGGLTTLVNLIAYGLLARGMHLGVTASTALAWLLAVVFAYATNRKWVFQSKASGWRAVSYEVATFFGGRLLSGLLDIAIMYIFVERLGYPDLLLKVLSNILVILINYVISKWVVFGQKRKNPADS